MLFRFVDASEKKTGTATPEYPTPVEITKDFLTRAVSTAAADEESTNYAGTWYPTYVHVSATVHKDGGYTQFKVEGYDGYISLSSAPSSMFADASGTSWGEGNEVEILGYYTGWESKNSYHQLIAVSVTGKATYTPVEAAVAGDDVFIAANVAHDKQVTNGNAFTNPIVVGDASFSFLGGGNNGKYYDAGTAARMYKDGSLEIKSSKPIIKIEYLFAPKDNNGTYNPVEADLSKLFTVGECSWNADKNILTWTGKAMEVVLAYPLTSGHYRFQQVGVTYGQDVEPRLSASPQTLTATAEDVSAKFNIQSNTAWTITSDKEDFVVRPSSGEGDAEITVVFPKNTSTQNEVVAKFTISAASVQDVVVTLTQAKAVDTSQATDLATITAITTANTEVDIIAATVAAVTTKGCIISDGTNHVYVYKNGDPGVAIGDVINVKGKIGAYNNGLQVGSPTITKTGVTAEPRYGQPVDISESYATYSNANKHAAYVTFVATPKKSGNYTNLYFEGGDSPYASFVNAASSLYEGMEMGAKYRFTGFYTGKASAYHQVVYVSMEKIGDAAPELKVAKNQIDVAATATSTQISVTANVAWTATVTGGNATLAGANGTTGTTINGNGNGTVGVSFAANEDTENAKEYKVVLSGEGVSSVEVIIIQAKATAQGGGGSTGSWVRVTSVDQITSGTYIIGYEAEANSGIIVPLRSDAAGAKTSANGILNTGTTGGTTSDAGTINMATITDTKAYEVGMGPSASVSGAKNIKLGELGLVGAPAAKNTARLYTEDCANTAYVITAKDNDTFQFYCAAGKSGDNEYCYLQYNTGSPRFCNYTGGQKNPVIYKYVAAE